MKDWLHYFFLSLNVGEQGQRGAPGFAGPPGLTGPVGK